MASPKLQTALQQATNAVDKSSSYGQILSELVNSPFSSIDEQSASLIAYTDSLVSSSLGIISTKPLLSSLIQSLSSAPSEVKIAVGKHITEGIQTSPTSFEEQNFAIREILATGYEDEEEWSKAAQALQGIQLESTQRPVADTVKVNTLIRIVRCYLEDDDTVSAETALNRIKNSTAATQVLSDSPELQLLFQLSQARILDARRDFINAANEYYAVSLSKTAAAEEDRLQALSAAIKVAILAGAGPQRSKTLGRFYKDERAVDVAEYGMLEKMYLDRLLLPEEVEVFASSLQDHQLAKTADGSTVLDKAVVEHNLLAASRLYDHISTTSLAQILNLKDSKDGTAAERAEEYASRMIEQGRLKAQIDQIDQMIKFDSVSGVPMSGHARELRLFDLSIQGLVNEVETTAAGIAQAYPHLAAPVSVLG